MYPHKAVSYAREHLQNLKLGPVGIADATGLMEAFVNALLPREAQSVVRFLLGLNAEICQAGPVNRPRLASRLQKTRPRHDGPVKRKLSKEVLADRHAKRSRDISPATTNS
jgi:hypothetical protein